MNEKELRSENLANKMQNLPTSNSAGALCRLERRVDALRTIAEDRRGSSSTSRRGGSFRTTAPAATETSQGPQGLSGEPVTCYIPTPPLPWVAREV